MSEYKTASCFLCIDVLNAFHINGELTTLLSQADCMNLPSTGAYIRSVTETEGHFTERCPESRESCVSAFLAGAIVSIVLMLIFLVISILYQTLRKWRQEARYVLVLLITLTNLIVRVMGRTFRL